MLRLLAVAALVACSLNVQADDSLARAAIMKLVPNATIDSVAEAKLEGYYEFVVGGQVVYVSKDGKYLVQGVLYDIENRTDLTEASRAKLRVGALKEATPDMRIIFAPAKPKHVVTVFTDIDCGYCRRMHAQVPEYNELGIAVEYLFFPRAGAGSESWQKAVSVWCSDDRRQAMTDAKAGKEIDVKECANSVEAEFNLGQRIGVNGTPAVIAADGTQVGGYLPPAEMLQRLEQLAARPAK